MEYSYHTAATEDGITSMIVLDNEVHQVAPDHPRAKDIAVALLQQVPADELRVLLAPMKSLPRYLEALTDRISVSDEDELYFDGERVENSLSQAVMDRYLDGYEDVTPLLNFYEKLMQNPSQESREQLYDFLDNHGMHITADGDFLAHKGLREDFTSVHAGHGIVNGEVIERGHLDNSPGNLIEYPRSEVSSDPNVACDQGLHAGSHDYATRFGVLTVTVKINPRDVISVPKDYSWAKIRTCRYVVIKQDDEKFTSTYYEDDGFTPESRPSPEEYQEFIQEMQDASASFSRKGKVGQSYAAIAEALGYTSDSPQMFFAQQLDLSHTANAVYRYHILALE